MQVLYQKPDLRKLRKQGLTYVDMHCHTSETDSSAKVFLTIKKAQLLKMGLAITDHNNINAVLKAQKNKKLLLIPGIEVTSYDYMDLLLYFYNVSELKEFYLKYVHKNKRPNRGFDFNRLKFTMKELLGITNKYNCLKAIAHPYAPYPQNSFSFFNNQKNKRLIKKFEAVEVMNSLMGRERNEKAKKWTDSINKSYIGGSDAHSIHHLGKTLTISESENIESFLDSIKKKKNFVMGEELVGLTSFYSSLIVFKNNLRLRVQKEVEDIKEEIKEDFSKSKEKVKKFQKKLKKL